MSEELKQTLDTITKSVISECKSLGLSERDTKRIILEHPILNQIKSEMVRSHQISTDVKHELLEGNK